MAFAYLAFFESSDDDRAISEADLATVAAIIKATPALVSANLYTPETTKDMYNRTERSPVLGLQLYFEELTALENAVGPSGHLQQLAAPDILTSIEGARATQQAMYVRPFPVDDGRLRTGEVTAPAVEKLRPDGSDGVCLQHPAWAQQAGRQVELERQRVHRLLHCVQGLFGLPLCMTGNGGGRRQFFVADRAGEQREQFLAWPTAQRALAATALFQFGQATRRLVGEAEGERVVEQPRSRHVERTRADVAPQQQAPQQGLARCWPFGGTMQRLLGLRVAIALATNAASFWTIDSAFNDAANVAREILAQ